MTYPSEYKILLFGEHGDKHQVFKYDEVKFTCLEESPDYFTMNNDYCECDYYFASDIDFLATKKSHDPENKYPDEPQYSFVDIFAVVIDGEWLSRSVNPWSETVMDESEWSKKIWGFFQNVKGDQCFKVYDAISID